MNYHRVLRINSTDRYYNQQIEPRNRLEAIVKIVSSTCYQLCHPQSVNTDDTVDSILSKINLLPKSKTKSKDALVRLFHS